MKAVLLVGFAVVLGCSSSPQRKVSSDEGVPAVVATACPEDKVCVGDTVLALKNHRGAKINYVGQVIEIENNFYYLHNGTPDGEPFQIKTTEVFKTLKCYQDRLCVGPALDKAKQAEYTISHIFINGQVMAHQGNTNELKAFKVDDLINSCECIGEICVNQKTKSQKGYEYNIAKIYQNGVVSLSDSTFEVPVFITLNLKEIGGDATCTNETPCKCTK